MRVGSAVRAGKILLGAFGLLIGFATAALAGNTYGPNGPSNINTNRESIAAASSVTVGLINDRITQITVDFVNPNSSQLFLLGNGGGKAAGDEGPRIGFWGALGNNWVRDTQTGTDFTGTVLSGLGGVDYKFTPWLLLGLSGGYEAVNLNTGFNAGNQNSGGGVVSVYGAVRLDEMFSITGLLGKGWFSYNENHTGTNGSFTGDRWFSSINLNAVKNIDSWRLMGSLGYFYFSEIQSSYTESNGNFVPSDMPYLGEIRAKGQVGYAFKTDWGTITPYASARLEFDTNYSNGAVINSFGQRASVSTFGTTFGLGVRSSMGDRASFILEGQTTQFRQNFESYGISGSFRIAF